jgi:hypothetical protein
LNLNDDQLHSDAGRIGIGTTSPSAKLVINAGAETPLKIKGNGGNYAVGITQNQVGGSATMEFTTADSSGAQATRLLFRGNSDDINIEFCRGARESEQVSMIIEGTNGNVGIGTTSPSEKLEVNGTIKCTSIQEKSDQNLKENIQPLEQGLQALMNYKPVSYDWKKEDANKKRNYGFLAQDMQALHADTSIVSGSEQDHGLTISYTQLIPVLTKSIQELNEKLETLSHKVAGTA